MPTQIAVDASRCPVRIGDRVAPDTLLGAHPTTGQIVTAGCHGEVVALRFVGGEHVVVITVQPVDT
jgi:hypothetical protein